MKDGDRVEVRVIGKRVGPGQIVSVGNTVYVLVERPHGGPYLLGAPRSWFTLARPGNWCLDMPATTLCEFMPPEGSIVAAA
jgi:hypothetical protein